MHRLSQTAQTWLLVLRGWRRTAGRLHPAGQSSRRPPGGRAHRRRTKRRRCPRGRALRPACGPDTLAPNPQNGSRSRTVKLTLPCSSREAGQPSLPRWAVADVESPAVGPWTVTSIDPNSAFINRRERQAVWMSCRTLSCAAQPGMSAIAASSTSSRSIGTSAINAPSSP